MRIKGLGRGIQMAMLTAVLAGLVSCLQAAAWGRKPAPAAPLRNLVGAPVAAAIVTSQAADALQSAMVGSWVGTLAYRDYAEPATSTKRVLLPTWLTVTQVDGRLRWHYVYDDGPSKTVTDDERVHVEAGSVGGANYVTQPGDGKPEQRLTVQGLEELKAGHGTVTMTGQIVEKNAPAQIRVTLHVGRNLLELTRETGATGQPLAFRDAYTFVRRDAPVIGSAATK
jgi:hypothetical protein